MTAMAILFNTSTLTQFEFATRTLGSAPECVLLAGHIMITLSCNRDQAK